MSYYSYNTLSTVSTPSSTSTQENQPIQFYNSIPYSIYLHRFFTAILNIFQSKHFKYKLIHDLWLHKLNEVYNNNNLNELKINGIIIKTKLEFIHGFEYIKNDVCRNWIRDNTKHNKLKNLYNQCFKINKDFFQQILNKNQKKKIQKALYPNGKYIFKTLQ